MGELSRVGADNPPPALGMVLREWGRIGAVGFGGPPTQIRLVRDLCVERERWVDAAEFEDAVAACNLLPGPSGTQIVIYCAWRVRGGLGAVLGGLAFMAPGLVMILALAVVFLGGAPPVPISAAGAGAAAAVTAVAVHAGWGLLPSSWHRSQSVGRAARIRWLFYVLAGGLAAATLGTHLVLVLLACGLIEVVATIPARDGQGRTQAVLPALVASGGTVAGLWWSLSWLALKVGALSYGGGFVIIPMMQTDAVDRYHWMTAPQFLTAVALGQITPGPVVHTVGVVGYAAAGIAGALLATAVAFSPSFLIVLVGARYFHRLRSDARARAFFNGGGPAAIGAILGSAIPLVLALSEPWQLAVLAGAAVMLFVLRRGIVVTLLAAGAAGVLLVTLGAHLPH